jgi:hypothetical protein
MLVHRKRKKRYNKVKHLIPKYDGGNQKPKIVVGQTIHYMVMQNEKGQKKTINRIVHKTLHRNPQIGKCEPH